VIVPSLIDAARSGDPHAFVAAAAHAMKTSDDAVLVAHSGAGSLLPLIAVSAPSARRMVFVDAAVPPCEGSFTVGAEFLTVLRSLATDGVLPAWSEWWGDDNVMRTLVADDDRRRAIENELPLVPLAFFEAELAAPSGWCDAAASYVLLSEPYRAAAARASSMGWSVLERPSTHLGIANAEHATADVLVELGSCR
jgi:hypothetical protein